MKNVIIALSLILLVSCGSNSTPAVAQDKNEWVLIANGLNLSESPTKAAFSDPKKSWWLCYYGALYRSGNGSNITRMVKVNGDGVPCIVEPINAKASRDRSRVLMNLQ